MSAKRKMKLVANAEFEALRQESFTLPDGTTISRGDAVSVAGENGVWRLSYVFNGQPVLYGGELGHGQLRSFKVERLGVVKAKVRRNLSDEQRQALRDRMEKVRQARKVSV